MVVRLSDRMLAVFLGAIIAVMPFSMDCYLSAIPTIAMSFSASIPHVELSIGIFLLGAAIGQLIAGPLSDIKGRRPIGLLGLLLYIVASFAILWSQTVEQFIMIRMVQAIGAGAAGVVVSAITRDLFQGKKAVQMFALIGMVMIIAPMIAPMVGAFLLHWSGWQAIFVFVLMYSMVILLLAYFFMPETRMISTRVRNRSFLKQIQSQYAMIFSQYEALGFLFLQGLSFAAMMVFITESPFVYMKLYDVSPSIYPFYAACNIIVMAICNRITAFTVIKHRPETILLWGIVLQNICNVVLVILALLMQPPVYVLLGLVMFSIGLQGMIVPNSTACYMESFPNHGGTAAAVLGTCQFMFAAVGSWLVTVFHNGTLLPMVGMMLVCTMFGSMILLFLSRRRFKSSLVYS